MGQDNSSNKERSPSGLASELTHAQRTSTQVVEAMDAGQAFTGEREGGAERAQYNANYAERQAQVLQNTLINRGDLSKDSGSFARLLRQSYEKIKADSDDDASASSDSSEEEKEDQLQGYAHLTFEEAVRILKNEIFWADTHCEVSYTADHKKEDLQRLEHLIWSLADEERDAELSEPQFAELMKVLSEEGRETSELRHALDNPVSNLGHQSTPDHPRYKTMNMGQTPQQLDQFAADVASELREQGDPAIPPITTAEGNTLTPLGSIPKKPKRPWLDSLETKGYSQKLLDLTLALHHATSEVIQAQKYKRSLNKEILQTRAQLNALLFTEEQLKKQLLAAKAKGSGPEKQAQRRLENHRTSTAAKQAAVQRLSASQLRASERDVAATKEVALIEHYSSRYLSDKDRLDMLNKVSLQFWTPETCEICAQATNSCEHCQLCKDTRSCPTCKAAEAREPNPHPPHQRNKALGSTAVSPHPSVEEEEEGQMYPKASKATLDKNLVMPANC